MIAAEADTLPPLFSSLFFAFHSYTSSLKSQIKINSLLVCAYGFTRTLPHGLLLSLAEIFEWKPVKGGHSAIMGYIPYCLQYGLISLFAFLIIISIQGHPERQGPVSGQCSMSSDYDLSNPRFLVPEPCDE